MQAMVSYIFLVITALQRIWIYSYFPGENEKWRLRKDVENPKA